MHISLEFSVHKCKNNIEFIIDTKAFKSDRMENGKKFRTGMKKIEYGLHRSAEGYASIEYITRLNARKDKIDDLKENYRKHNSYRHLSWCKLYFVPAV